MSSRLKIHASVFAVFGAALSVPGHTEPTQDNPVITRANELKAQAEAETEAFNAAKARSEAQTAAAKAAFGTLADHENSGTVEVGENSGKLEVALLASEATRMSAQRIVQDICTRTSAAALLCNERVSSDLLLITDADKPTFDSYDAFRLQLLAIQDELQTAKSSACGGRPAIGAQVIPLAGIGTAVNIAANLLRSEYKLSYVDLTPNDGLLLKALLENARPSIHARLLVPSLFPQRIDMRTNPVLVDLGTAKNLRDTVSECAQASAKRKKTAAAAAAKAVERFDAFYTKLQTSDDKGVVPLAIIARQAQLAEVMDRPNTYALFVKQEMAGGSAYAKKNFATFLGAMPFFVSGGSLSTYTLQKTDTGEVVYAGILPQTRPFMRVHEATHRYLYGSPAR